MRSEARVVITNPTGLHARPAVKLAQLAAGSTRTSRSARERTASGSEPAAPPG